MEGKHLKVDQLNKIIEAKVVIIGNAGNLIIIKS
jgi:hypothetical protein